MTLYLHGFTTKKKLITWECASWPELRIVLSNISNSDLKQNFSTLEPSATRNLEWLEPSRVKSRQTITINTGRSYFYPRLP